MILGIIPARGDTKGIRKKNIKPLASKPLISYTIVESLKSKYITDLIVSTDDHEIADIAKECGAIVPFIRPKELATDKARSIEVVLHALGFMEDLNKITYNYVILLQPTAPLRTVNDIDNAIEKLLSSEADSIVSLCRLDDPHPMKLKILKNGLIYPYLSGYEEGLPRQSLPELYRLNGAIYATKREVIVRQKSFFGTDSKPYLMPPERSVNIDNILDFYLAEYLLSIHLQKK